MEIKVNMFGLGAFTLRRFISGFLSITLLLATPVPLLAETPSPSHATDTAELADNLQLLYWTRLDHDMPWLTEFALGKPVMNRPLWRVQDGDPLLDSDPFFMRTQNWEPSSADACTSGVCFEKDHGDLVLIASGWKQELRLNRPLTPVLETRDYVILTADDLSLFEKKNPQDQNPGEGFFFIAKRDLKFAISRGERVPVFFFPLPGNGWTGGNPHSLELDVSDQVVLYDHDGFGLPIDRSDIAVLEKVERNNLLLAQTWNFLNGRQDHLPMANATLGFGLFLSGQMPNTVRSASTGPARKFENMASAIGQLVLPQAAAATEDDSNQRPTILSRIRRLLQRRTQGAPTAVATDSKPRSHWKRWIAPFTMYGGILGLAAAANEHINWQSLITSDMPQRIETVAAMLGAVLVASVIMKYSVHKAYFDKKYPKTADETILQRLNKEHKGVLDELTHGLWFSVAFLPQGIRHILEFLKDRFFPDNKMVHKAWDETMGFQMRQSSRLAMNWKTFYLGSMVFGMADSFMVALDLLIFTPWLVQHLGWNLGVGTATAAFASSEILRNFLAYLQRGAHSYSSDVKQIHLKSAEEEAKRQLRASGLNPEAIINESMLHKIAEQQMEKRFKAVGLPGADEFLYDPITFFEGMVKRSGFSIHDKDISADERAKLQEQTFVLSQRRWGLIKPALKRALHQAEEAYANAAEPTTVGRQTIDLLKWALNDRSLTKGAASHAVDLIVKPEARVSFRDSVDKAVATWLAGSSNPTWLGMMGASAKGALKYFTHEGTQKARDIRMVLFLASTTGSLRSVLPYLPESWRQMAGSNEAATLGAELFHRAFFSLYENMPERILPNSQLEAQYGARANRILDRIAPREPALNDPFVRQVRYWELMFRLKKHDQSRMEILSYTPKALSPFARKQWAIARNAAEQILAHTDLDQETPDEVWLNLAEAYNGRAAEKAPTFDWIRSYRYKMIVAQQFAKQVGLTVNGAENSEFVRKAILNASIKTESELNVKKERFYRMTLSPEDREFYEAQLFTRYFINSYIDLSVYSDEHITAESPEYPGRFQSVRRALVGVPGGKIISAGVRTFEAFFRNVGSSYAPGGLAWLDRNIPIMPDMFHNFWNNARNLPYGLTLSYLTSYYVWQIKMPYPLFALFMLTGFIGLSFVEFNTRLMKNYNIKPMDDVPSKLTFSFIHSRLTNPEIMLIQAYAQPIVDGVDNYVVAPVKDFVKSCGNLLTHEP